MASQVKHFPPPRTNSLCGGSGAFATIQRNPDLTDEKKLALSSSGGQLNPDWVEWLMGWPVGWTDAGREEVGEWLDLGEDPAEWDADDARHIGRLTTRRKFRAPRIKCLGNGQVPLCAAIAFEEGILRLFAAVKQLRGAGAPEENKQNNKERKDEK